MASTTPTSSSTPPASAERTRAVFFDIDGTLIDSNYLHVEAWSHAFSDLELNVPDWRIHRLIGMDSAGLLDELLGDDADTYADRAKDLHSEYYSAMAPRLRTLESARELLAALSDRGLSVVLATSAPGDELVSLLKVLDTDTWVSEVTSGDDVEEAKPNPGIVQVALDRAGSAPADTIMIGDAVWDIKASARAGVDCIAVQSGGTSRAELEEAGAVAVYDDVAQLLAELDSSPIARLFT
ncbi:MAG: HAD family hydrolase [Glaciihabitans sp.]